MSIKTRSTLTGAVAVCVSAMLWGLDGVVLTPNLFNLDVAYVVFMFHLIPFVLMHFFLGGQYRYLKIFSRSDYLFLLLIALFGGATGTLAIVHALFLVEFKKLTVVVLLQKLQPVFAVILAMIILGEKPRRNYFFWASMALISAYFLTFGFQLPDFGAGRNTTLAALYALLAAFSFGSSTVFGKKILNTVPFHTATFFRFGFTTLIMLLVVLATGKLEWIAQTTPTNWLIFFIIAFTTGSGAIFLYYYGLRKVRASVAAICELCFPLSAIFFDYIVNNQLLTAVQWISAGFLLFAIVMLNLQGSRSNASDTN